MKILYDQQIFSFQDYGGISRYYYELIKRLRANNNTILVDGKYSNNIYLKKIQKRISEIFPKLYFPLKNIIVFYLNVFLDSKILKSNDFDLFHATYYHPYFLNMLKKKPFVVTVYDMTHELFKKSSKGLVERTLIYKKQTIHKADRIIAISKNTKKDIVDLYNISEDKIQVIYLGNPLTNIKPSKTSGLPGKYILFVGNRSGHKNFNLFVKSISELLKNDNNLYLVCAGGGAFTMEEYKLLLELKIMSKVKIIIFKTDKELAYIYKKALIYILPSLYEGFGMTALEAFSMGCPVVASNTSSIPEVCGKAVVYIDPKNEKSIKTSVERVMTDNELRNSLIKLGFEQIKKFSWDKTVEKTLKVYKQVLSNQKRQGKK